MPIIGNTASGGKKPSTPTIGTATDGGTGTTASVAFTPSTYIGKGTITYTATSSPGSLTATGSGSPLTVTGLTTGTAYTFTVRGNTNYGVASDSSAASNSVTPAAASSYESIATVTGTGSSATLTFSGIPSTYKHLQIRGRGFGTTGGQMFLRFNGVSSTTYTRHRIVGYNYGVSASGETGQTSIRVCVDDASYASMGTTYPAVAIVDVIDYASTTKNKTVRTLGGIDSASAANGEIDLTSGVWLSTSAVTSVSLIITGSNFTTNTTFALYGIKG